MGVVYAKSAKHTDGPHVRLVLTKAFAHIWLWVSRNARAVKRSQSENALTHDGQVILEGYFLSNEIH